MDLEKIKELMEAMEDRGMTKVVVKQEDGYVIELERGSDFEVAPYPMQAAPAPAPVLSPSLPKEEEQSQGGAEPKQVETKEGYPLTSPMVGTYYASPSPEDPSFVKVGDTVTEDTVVCIIEAMKVMNEVKAGRKGVVTEVLVENASPVEFGTKLLTISES